MSNLLIVESPSKAKTIGKYLGKGYEVLASYGHVRDLLPKTGAINTDTFEMQYALIEKNKRHVDEIIRAVKRADNILLATDPDREGEAISWHLYEILKEKKLLNNKQIKRVILEEITQSAITEAIKKPRDLSNDLVNAQQARRALDYLVGFNLSPLLWKKIRRGLSAGRVQSPALRLIIDRELEIEKFIQQEYWTIHLDAQKEKSKFLSKLIILNNEKLEQFSITSQEQQSKIVGELLLKSSGKAKVSRVEKKQRIRKPSAPFTTSTLQQEAVRKLGFTTNRTMRVAQQLYEGIETREGAIGLISYMRTDSMTLSNESIAQIRGYLKQNYDAEYLPLKAIGYKTKSKNAQEAHEAIRPTNIDRTPQSLRSYLSDEQFKLYDMIWKRTLACQMSSAIFDAVSIDIEVGKGETIFRATGQTLKFPGFMSVYLEGEDDVKDEDDEAKLPNLEVGDLLTVNKIYGDQHFTEPPPRYTEASLVKILEEYGIGRPSTYASIISTLQDREYALLDKKRFTPTDVGKVVNKFLTQHFSHYVDYDFTAGLETKLDNIARSEQDWIEVIKDFWIDFEKQVKEKENIDRSEITQEAIDEQCPKCDKPLYKKLGRRGNFIACSGYPDCDFTRNVNGELPQEPQTIYKDEESEKEVLLMFGPYGPYLQLGIQDKEDKKKPKRVSIPADIPISQVTEEVARKLMSLPLDMGIHPDTNKKIIANIGRFGPYVNHDGKFKSIPKSESIFDITHERAVELINEAIAKNAPLRVIEEDPEKNLSIEVLNGRYGPYIQRGSTKAPIPKNIEIDDITLEFALELISKKEGQAKGKKKRKVGAKKAA